MNEQKPSAWPQVGLERFFNYHCNFIHLNINLGSAEACHRYHDKWLNRYNSSAKTWTDYDVVIWSLRCRQSLKLSFSATYFAMVAEQAKKDNVLASSYYFAYYSMLHAMWAVIYLHPDQTVDTVTDITHSKISNVFQSSFTTGQPSVLQATAQRLAEDLKFLREYYSYRMPLNSPFEPGDSLSQAHIHLGGFVKQSIQLANLHSHLIRKVAEKAKRVGASVAVEEREAFKAAFFRINGKEHITRRKKLLDPADLEAQAEYLRVGCDIMPLSLEVEHMSDNYMTYGKSTKMHEDMIQKTSSLVQRALF